MLEVGQLSKGESILIYTAAGSVGQAAVMIAKRAEAEIFTTVGSVGIKNLTMETYAVPEDHIFSSRGTSFEHLLMGMTQQRRVDVVLNSTSGDILHQSWRCLAALGRFIENGKPDLVQNFNLEWGNLPNQSRSWRSI